MIHVRSFEQTRGNTRLRFDPRKAQQSKSQKKFLLQSEKSGVPPSECIVSDIYVGNLQAGNLQKSCENFVCLGTGGKKSDAEVNYK